MAAYMCGCEWGRGGSPQEAHTTSHTGERLKCFGRGFDGSIAINHYMLPRIIAVTFTSPQSNFS